MVTTNGKLTQSGRYSPLRYPGGKGKLAKFVRDIIRSNGLSDGQYVEPYAGGAAVACELLLTGVVRRITINDISKPVYAFWNSAINNTDALCDLIEQRPITVPEWDKWKDVYRRQATTNELELGFSFFYLNRTNRSGILNGGVIGGRNQTGKWKIDARYNKSDLIQRIRKIASFRRRIEVTNLDAIDLITTKSINWKPKTLIYLDPPYFEKGRFLYHDAYKSGDHLQVAKEVQLIEGFDWIVSYDDVRPIHDLYEKCPWLQYTLNYSARNQIRGREAMFFSPGLNVPEINHPLVEIDRDATKNPRPVSKRSFAA